MGKVIHDWEDKLAVGQAGESALDEYFAEPGLKIHPVEFGCSDNWQALGIDRWFVRKGYWLPIEYKTDFQTAKTGNLFLETRKNCNGKGKAGWAKTSLAKIIYYYVPQLGKIYGLRPDIWMSYPEQLDELRTAKAYNDTYHSEGALLPEKHARGFCFSVHGDAPTFHNEEALLKWFKSRTP